MSISKKIIIVTTIVAFGLIFLIKVASTLYSDIAYASGSEVVNELQNNGSQTVLAQNNIQQAELPVTVETVNESAKTIEEFSLSIPSINLSHKIARDVDPRDPKIYLPILDSYIAHGMFTFLPDQAIYSGNVYLYAHRSSYQGQQNGFFQNLDKIKSGDQAIIKFDGKTYIYTFRNNKIVKPTNTEIYTSYSPTPTLTMQTCNNGTSERLILWWDLVEVN